MKDYITDNAVDPIISVRLDGKITYCNKAACDLLRYSKSQLEGSEYQSLLSNNSAMSFDKVRESILFNERIKPFLTERLKRNGEVITVMSQYSLVRDKENKVIGISSIFRRISEFDKAASRAQALLETAPDAMVIVNEHGQIALVNAQTEKLFGYNRYELLGREVEMLIPDKFLKRHQQHRKKFNTQPKTRSMGQGLELFGKRKDGNTFPVEISLSPLKNDEGLFISAAIRDITYRKKAEKKFKGLLESAPDAMVIVSESGRIQLVNTQVENIFGYRREELLNQKVEKLIPMGYKKAHQGHRSKFFSNPKMRPMGAGLELMGLRKNGDKFPVEISLSPLETEEGILVSAAIRDITERKKVEKELETYNQQLQNKNQELEQFAYVASHDLQEPLRTVSNFSRLLKERYHDNLDKTGRKYFQYITESTDRMGDLIKGLLEYSRIGINKKLSMVDCNDILKNVKKDLSTTIKDHNAKIIIGKMPVVKGFSTELRMLFQNLISNAIKFCRPDTIPEISVSAISRKDSWLFSVNDNGIGISDEHLDRIFAIFQRLHSQTKYKGTGIGLAHCRKIMELHGGQIWVESELNVGSSFKFTLPK